MVTRLIVKALCAQLLLGFFTTQGWSTPCVVPPVSAQAIAQFKSNPRSLIAPDADTRTIEATVRDLAGTDATLAVDFVQLARETTPRFRTAIAAGLAQAAIACSNVDQHAGLVIQQAVASFDDGEFQNAFAAVAGDLSTAATEAALGAAAASVGSVVVTNPNTGGRTGTNPGGGGGIVFLQFSAPVATAPTIGQTTSATAASQVSATR
jgi:hypothetical protein